MGATSQLLRIERIDEDSFDYWNPVSTYRAWALRNNLSHLVDEYAQHRINWSLATSDPTFHTIVLGIPWTQVFMHSWLKPNRPANLHIIISLQAAPGEGTDFDVDIFVRVSPATPTPTALTIAFGAVTYNTSAMTSPLLVADALLDMSDLPSVGGQDIAPNAEIQSGLIGTNEDGQALFPIVTLAQLEITLSTTDVTYDSGTSHVIQVSSIMVREYA